MDKKLTVGLAIGLVVLTVLLFVTGCGSTSTGSTPIQPYGEFLVTALNESAAKSASGFPIFLKETSTGDLAVKVDEIRDDKTLELLIVRASSSLVERVLEDQWKEIKPQDIPPGIKVDVYEQANEAQILRGRSILDDALGWGAFFAFGFLTAKVIPLGGASKSAAGVTGASQIARLSESEIGTLLGRVAPNGERLSPTAIGELRTATVGRITQSEAELLQQVKTVPEARAILAGELANIEKLVPELSAGRLPIAVDFSETVNGGFRRVVLNPRIPQRWVDLPIVGEQQNLRIRFLGFRLERTTTVWRGTDTDVVLQYIAGQEREVAALRQAVEELKQQPRVVIQNDVKAYGGHATGGDAKALAEGGSATSSSTSKSAARSASRSWAEGGEGGYVTADVSDAIPRANQIALPTINAAVPLRPTGGAVRRTVPVRDLFAPTPSLN